MINDEETRDNFLKDVCTFLRKFSRIPFGITPKVILIAWESFGKIKDALMDKQYRQEDIQELTSKLFEDVRNISEEFLEYINCPSWNRPLFYFNDDDDEYTVKWRRPKGISEDTCDVPVCEDPSTFDALNDNSEILSDSNDDGTLSDDDDFEDIEYVSLEEVNNDQEEKEFDLEDILQIQDVILREKLLNINRLIANIESLKDNPSPDRVFSDYTEETRSGSTTSHADISLLEYDSFLFEIEPDQEGLTSIVISDNSNDLLLELPEFESFHPLFPRPLLEPPDVEICFNFDPDMPVINNFDELNEDECFDPGGGEIDFSQNVEDDDSFTFVI
ncbi:hypothetical protein Tco_1478439 [Tanacetum coccineum]